jgi:serine/threonine-protein kinase
VILCQDCAHGFNPLGDPKFEHPHAALAIDTDPNTFWATQIYNNANLNKAGVGIYLDANPGIVARMLRIRTATPGWNATIYARKDNPPLTWPDPGWQQVGAPTNVQGTQDVTLSTGGAAYRYYLVWITSLGGHDQLQLNELTLYK